MTDSIITRHGLEHTVMVMGTANRTSKRTPITSAVRDSIIRAVHPDIRILHLSDYPKQPGECPDQRLIDWITRVRTLLSELDGPYKFYGGSEADLRILGTAFDTEILVDRETEGQGISATQARNAIVAGDFQKLPEFVDERTIPILRRWYKENIVI